MGKLVDRYKTYIQGERDQTIKENNKFLYHFRHLNINMQSPMWYALEKFEINNFQLSSMLFTIIFFLFVIDAVLIYSLMLKDVEERTYEFAMLRCLGFKNSSLVVLLFVQATFQSLPATIVGFLLSYMFMQAGQLALYIWLGIAMEIQLQWSMVFLSLLIGIAVPFLSNIQPIKKALGTSLRDALDRFRSGVDELLVQFVRAEDAGGSRT